MQRAAFAIAWLFLAAWAGAAQARQPVVVELFTSQGCSSCVAADKSLDELSSRDGVLALTFAVDYWDYLGWSDTFAKPEFTARQRAYMQRLASREVFTPQIIIDGSQQAAGADPEKLDPLITQAERERRHSPPMRFARHSKIAVGAGHAPRGGADVWLVRYDPSAQQVMVKRGDNRGQTLVQRNVVRDLVKLGTWTGGAKVYPLPPAPDRKKLKTCILLQGSGGGRILGVLQR